MSHISWAWYPESEAVEVTFDIDYEISRYYPQTWESPAEGGEIDGVTFTLESIKAFTGVGPTFAAGRLIPRRAMRPAAVAAWERAMDKRYGDDPAFQDRVHEAIYAAGRDDYYGD